MSRRHEQVEVHATRPTRTAPVESASSKPSGPGAIARSEDWSISPLTGEFTDPEVEASFRLDRWGAWSRQLRFAGFAGMVFYVAGAAVDALVVGSGRKLGVLVVIRLGIAALSLAITLAITRHPFRPQLVDSTILALLIGIAAGTCAIVTVSGGRVAFHSLTAFVIVLVFYLFVPNRLTYRVFAGGALSITFLVTAAVSLPSSPGELSLATLYLALANVLGASAARSANRQERLHYASISIQRATNESLRHEMDVRASVEAALAASESKHRSLVELSPDAIVLHRGGRIAYANPAAVRLVGAGKPEALVGRSVFEFIVNDDRPLATERLQKLLDSGGPGGPTRFRLRRADGRIMVCEIVSGLAPGSGGDDVQSVIRDVTDQFRLEEELKKLASTDYLTGARNRRSFFEQAETEWRRARRHHRPLSVMMLDLDHFKRVNDIYGHALGDEVLRLLVATSRRILRSEDILGRYGGEEFAVVLPEVDGARAAAVAERVRSEVAEAVATAGGRSISCTVSVGVTEGQVAGESLDDALRRADEALYEAKAAGRNLVRLR